MLVWRFLHPGFLFLLPLPLIWLAWHLKSRVRRHPSLLMSDLDPWRAGGATLRVRVLKALPWIRTLAMVLGIVALARPQYGQVQRIQSAFGIDIALVLDISESMDLPDIQPDRMTVAKEVLREFVRERTSDRLSVIVFGTNSYPLVPPTFDIGAIEGFIERLDPRRTVPREQRMTAIGLGLARAVEKMKDSEAQSRVAILLTDGENTAGNIDPMQAAEAAKALGVRVYTIGFGTNGKITVRNAFGFPEEIVTTIDEDMLGKIAEMTGGKYFRAATGDALRDIYEEIDRLEKTDIETNEYDDFDERFMWLWCPALFLLLGEFLLRTLLLTRLP